jgi:hypothetical protein
MRTIKEISYRLFMQLGEGSLMDDSSQDGGIGVNLVWTNLDGIHETLASRNGGIDSAMTVLKGSAAISVLADLDTQSYQLSIGGDLIQSGIPFDNTVNLDTLRFFTDGLNEKFIRGRCFDDLRIETITDAGLIKPSEDLQSRTSPTFNLMSVIDWFINFSGH